MIFMLGVKIKINFVAFFGWGSREAAHISCWFPITSIPCIEEYCLNSIAFHLYISENSVGRIFVGIFLPLIFDLLFFIYVCTSSIYIVILRLNSKL